MVTSFNYILDHLNEVIVDCSYERLEHSFFLPFLAYCSLKDILENIKNENYNDKCRAINGNQNLLLEFIISLRAYYYIHVT